MPRESAGGIILNPEGKILIVHQNGDSWSFPKGGIEEGESALDAARREIAEEAGITELTLVADLGSYERYSIAKGGVGEDTALGMRKRTFFLFTTTQTDTHPQDSEVTHMSWVTLDEAMQKLTHPKDREFLANSRGNIEEWTRSH